MRKIAAKAQDERRKTKDMTIEQLQEEASIPRTLFPLLLFDLLSQSVNGGHRKVM